MSRPGTERAARTIAAAVALGSLLAGCSDIYFDRRDTVALTGGDSIAGNAITQTADPRPPQAATRPSPSMARRCSRPSSAIALAGWSSR